MSGALMTLDDWIRPYFDYGFTKILDPDASSTHTEWREHPFIIKKSAKDFHIRQKLERRVQVLQVGPPQACQLGLVD